MSKVVAVIPARFQSSRFPGKPLHLLLGKPMILRVADLATQALGKENVWVATDDARIEEVVKSAGYSVAMTDAAATGTDRLFLAAQSIPDADVFVNIQGDEPLLDPQDILRVVEAKKEGFVTNGMRPLLDGEDPASVNIPKVVFGEDRRALYLSRSPVPGSKSEKSESGVFWKQVCIYAFSRSELEAFGNYYRRNGRKAPLEDREDIEVLRFLEIGIPIQMVETKGASMAVDTPEDAERVEEVLKKNA